MIIRKWIEKIKVRWEISRDVDFLLIMLVFALTGFSILYVSDFLMPLVGVRETSPLWVVVLVKLLLIVPVYQVLLLIFGFMLGQFSFFWKKEKKLFRWILKIFPSGSN